VTDGPLAGMPVLEVQHPRTGDSYRGLSAYGLHNTYHGLDPFFASVNRGKRSAGIDLKRRGRRPDAVPRVSVPGHRLRVDCEIVKEGDEALHDIVPSAPAGAARAGLRRPGA
jgi:CoA-transferase family III